MACDRLAEAAWKKRKAVDGDEQVDAAQPKFKQPKLDSSSTIQLSQNIVDNYVIIDYVVDSVLPMHMVGLSYFQASCTGGSLLPPCRQTFDKQLQERFEQWKSDLKVKLKELPVVCTTADCWSSIRRSFLGITVGDFTFWLSLWLRPKLSPKIGLSPKLIRTFVAQSY